MKELVIEISTVKLSQVWAFGGFSSSKNEFIKNLFGENPKKEQLDGFDELIKKSNIQFGPKWIKGMPAERTMRYLMKIANEVV